MHFSDVSNAQPTRSIFSTAVYMLATRFWMYLHIIRTCLLTTYTTRMYILPSLSRLAALSPPVSLTRGRWWTIHLALESIAPGSYCRLWKRGFCIQFYRIACVYCYHRSTRSVVSSFAFSIFSYSSSCSPTISGEKSGCESGYSGNQAATTRAINSESCCSLQ